MRHLVIHLPYDESSVHIYNYYLTINTCTLFLVNLKLPTVQINLIKCNSGASLSSDFTTIFQNFLTKFYTKEK